MGSSCCRSQPKEIFTEVLMNNDNAHQNIVETEQRKLIQKEEDNQQQSQVDSCQIIPEEVVYLKMNSLPELKGIHHISKEIQYKQWEEPVTPAFEARNRQQQAQQQGDIIGFYENQKELNHDVDDTPLKLTAELQVYVSSKNQDFQDKLRKDQIQNKGNQNELKLDTNQILRKKQFKQLSRSFTEKQLDMADNEDDKEKEQDQQSVNISKKSNLKKQLRFAQLSRGQTIKERSNLNQNSDSDSKKRVRFSPDVQITKINTSKYKPL